MADHQCWNCGANAPFFTDMYFPYTGVKKTIYLCKHHHARATTAFMNEVITP